MNKSGKAIAALCLLNSASVYALGVGEIKTHSALNQVLKAKIPLVSSKNEDPSNVIVSIASREAFKKAGIDRPHYLTQLKFTPVISKSGELSIDVSSNATITEPFVNFILNVEWPQGRTLKEFTILLDPPSTMSSVRTTPLALPKSPVITPAPSVASTQVSTYIAPSAQQALAKKYGPTKSIDTVWSIAKRLIKNGHAVTQQQMVLALYENNPKAFYEKNINALKKGAILQVPSDKQITGRTIAQANKEYAEQNTLWSSSTKTVTAPTVIAKAQSKPEQTVATDIVKTKLKNNIEEAKLTLLTPKHESVDNVEIEGNSNETPIGSTSPSEQASMAIEMATTLEEENKEVKSRLNDLESQVEKLQRLLTLKDQQLAQLQSTKPAAPQVTVKAADTATNTDDENNLPLYGGAFVIGLLGLFLARRSKKESTEKDPLSFEEKTVTPITTSEPEEEKIQIEDTQATLTVTEEGPLLSEFTPSEFDTSTQTQKADPLTECDVYIAYGRYQQAEDLIQNALASDPDNLEYKLKLLDVHFASANADSFEKVAQSLSSLKETDSNTWNNIADMGEDLCPNSELFLSPLNINTKEEAEAELSNNLIEMEVETNDEEVNKDDEFEFDFNLIKSEPINKVSESEAEFIEPEDDADTSLALAQASIDMEDLVSAREALDNVLKTGNYEQKKQAQVMLNNL
jgi:pilus assembly protein FimV